MKKILFLVCPFLLLGCSSVHFPQNPPLTDEERATFTCADIQADIVQTQATLNALRSGNAQAATGAALGSTALLAAMGGVSFDLIGTPIAHARALNATQTRFDQLHELATQKACASQAPAQSNAPDASASEASTAPAAP